MDDPIRELIELDAVNEADDTGRTALFYALSTLAVQTLVKAGANINIADNQCKTPLIHALLYNKNSDVVRALIDAGADVNIADEEGKTALLYAVQQGNKESVVRALIDAGADVNIADEEGKTALLYAVQQGNNENVVRALIAAGVDVNITDREGKTALFHSVISDNESTAMLLINAYADVNKDENSGKTALFYAVSKSMIQTLIAAGADINKVDKNGKSILLHAVMKHKENLALAMIEAGAYVNFMDEDNDSILFYSVMQNNEVLINALVKAGADINKTDQEGKTPLYFALMYRKENASRTLIQALAREGFEEERTTALFNASSKEEIQALVESGIDINSTNHKGQSPLHKAIQCKKRKVAYSLIQAGAEVNLVAENGVTPLFQACLTNSSELVKVLVDAGADVNKTDLSGKNSLYYIKDNLSIANSIISAGVEVNAKDNDGKTALFYAIRYNTTHVATAMIDAGADVKNFDDNDKSLLNFAVINRNESLVRALLKGGANANFIPNAGNPALFYAVLWDDDNIVKMLLKSGADVNVVLDEGKTILFFALENAAMVKTLIEDGGAHVNVKDIYGRTPLFYAITKSISTSTYLFEKGAKFQARDNCNLSILSSYVESTMSEYQCNIQKVLDGEGADLLLKHGVERGDVFDAIIDVVFRKLLYISSLNMPFFNYEDGLDAVQLARNANKVAENTKPPKENLIDNILSLICREVTNIKSFYEIQIPKIIPQLIELGANPNSADSDGNTALHYLTRLPFLGVSKDVIMEIYSQLKTFGVSIDATNRQLETPLLFCLSGAISKVNNNQHELSGIKMLVDICNWLLEDGANIQRTMTTGESVFHLVMELFRHGLVLDESIREGVIGETMKLLALFSGRCKTKKDKGITVNRRDINLNAPLHLWASLSLETVNEYHDSLLLKEKIVFKDFLKLILNYLLSCGAKLNDRNAMEQTPLHLCRTWAAVELLNDAGANPIVFDSLGRSPLLVALEKRTFAYSENSFYPDVLQDPYAFWVAALECNLDLWAVGRNGDTVMSGLIRYNNFVLAKALLDVADEKNYLHSDSLAMDILNGICKVRNTMNASWKSTLVEMILRSKKSFIVSKRNEETPLHFCSRNIVRNYAISRARYSRSDHWTIAKQLLWYGADPTVPDSNGQTCLDIAESCPVLKELLMKPMSIDEVPMLIPWLSVSEKYQPILAKTSRRQECEHVDSFWYHKTHLESGTFGLIFAGINEKDGREVAIKRTEKRRMGRREDKREIENLLALADCEQVVRYLHFFENEHFSYVVLELMEGNLNEYLSSYSLLDNLTSTQLCKHVVMGLKFLHGRNILHRDLKPTNILYKLSPNLSLKIADFGLSRRIDSTSSTVYGTNMGTRCWIAPEILTDTEGHSKSSDIFSCGLILHYILSVRRHPFAPSDCTNKSLLQIQNETEANVIKGELEGWDFSLSPEGSNLVSSMLSKDKEKRLSGAEALAHPFFWSKKKKIDLLIAVGNQPEFSCPRAKVTYALTAVENDLEASFGTIVKHVKWTDPGYVHMPAIYTEMTMGRKSPYDPFSVVELERFIRNAYAHVSESKRPTPVRKQLLEDFVFLEYFPNLVMEVYKAVNTHGWDQTREEVKYALKK